VSTRFASGIKFSVKYRNKTFRRASVVRTDLPQTDLFT
jgi:hypothetical protein